MYATTFFGSSRTLLIGVLGLVWFGVVLSLAAQGAFVIGPNALPIGITISATAPPLLVVAALYLSPAVRAAAKDLSPVALSIAQSWRILGGLFLALLAFDKLPGLFAWPAGLGDVAIGIAAPFVVWRLLHDPKFVKSANYRWFNYLGIFDFLVAFATATLASGRLPQLIDGVTAAPMGHLPLVMIPAFLVPIFASLHVLALYQARHA